MQEKLSKSTRKRQRVQAYFRVLDGEVVLPSFKTRIIRSLNNDGWDFAPDGREIRANFWRYIRSREHESPHLAMAAQKHMEEVIASLHPRRMLF